MRVDSTACRAHLVRREVAKDKVIARFALREDQSVPAGRWFLAEASHGDVERGIDSLAARDSGGRQFRQRKQSVFVPYVYDLPGWTTRPQNAMVAVRKGGSLRKAVLEASFSVRGSPRHKSLPKAPIRSDTLPELPFRDREGENGIWSKAIVVAIHRPRVTSNIRLFQTSFCNHFIEAMRGIGPLIPGMESILFAQLARWRQDGVPDLSLLPPERVFKNGTSRKRVCPPFRRC